MQEREKCVCVFINLTEERADRKEDVLSGCHYLQILVSSVLVTLGLFKQKIFWITSILLDTSL